MNRSNTEDRAMYTAATTDEILAEIARYQTIQKQCPPSSDNWQDASMALAELFGEMARPLPTQDGRNA